MFAAGDNVKKTWRGRGLLTPGRMASTNFAVSWRQARKRPSPRRWRGLRHGGMIGRQQGQRGGAWRGLVGDDAKRTPTTKAAGIKRSARRRASLWVSWRTPATPQGQEFVVPPRHVPPIPSQTPVIHYCPPTRQAVSRVSGLRTRKTSTPAAGSCPSGQSPIIAAYCRDFQNGPPKTFRALETLIDKKPFGLAKALRTR
jgi:hypothetical protein